MELHVDCVKAEVKEEPVEEQGCDCVKAEVKEEHVEEQGCSSLMSSSPQQTLRLGGSRECAEDVNFHCDKNEVKQDDVCVKEEPLETRDDLFRNTTTFYPAINLRPGSTRAEEEGAREAPRMVENKENQVRYATEREINLLVELIQENKAIIFDKRTDHMMIAKKQEAWANITKLYNASGIGATKSCQQLKRMWEHQKSKAKKKHTADKKEHIRTGGGPPPKDLDDTAISQFMSMIDKEPEFLENIYDSDASKRSRPISSEAVYSERSNTFPVHSTLVRKYCMPPTRTSIPTSSSSLSAKITHRPPTPTTGSNSVKATVTEVDTFGKPISSEVLYLERSNTFPVHSAPVQEYFMPPTRPTTPTLSTSISANTTHLPPVSSSAAKPDDNDAPPPTTAPASTRWPQKRRKCSSKFSYQGLCYEETMRLKNKEHKIEMEIKEKELELKAVTKQTLLVWKEAGLAVINAANAIYDKVQKM